MARSFVNLFELEILHDYYISGKCSDFLIDPSIDTQKLIRGYRSVYKARSQKTGQLSTSSLSVIYEESNNLPLVPVTEEIRFRFAMKLINPAFLNFTSLPPKTNLNEVYYYRNTGSATLTQSLIELQSKVFIYRFNSAGSPDELRVFGIDGAEIVELRETLTGGPDFEVQLDLLKYPDGKYKLELFDGGVTIGEFKEIYFDDHFKTEGVFGIIEIVADSNAMTPDELNIQFTSSLAKWRYFMVFREGAGGVNYFVTDTDPEAPLIVFEEKTDYDTAEQAFISLLLNDLPDGEVKMFRMFGELAYSENKKKAIQLTKNSVGGPIVFSNLPNLDIQNTKPYMIVFI